MFRGVVHVDPVDQVFLDPVTAKVGILLLDVGDGLIEIESRSIRPDKPTLRGIEMHALHEITERVGQLGELLAFRRIPPLEKILEEGIVCEDTFFQIVRVLFAPTTHEIDLLERPELLNAYRVVTRALRSYCRRGAEALAGYDFPSESPHAQLPIMSTGMVNEL
jgi:hypothetical protein